MRSDTCIQAGFRRPQAGADVRTCIHRRRCPWWHQPLRRQGHCDRDYLWGVIYRRAGKRSFIKGRLHILPVGHKGHRNINRRDY